jgi:hypothetical protein
MYNSNDELYHHGVKGMRWGVRKAIQKARNRFHKAKLDRIKRKAELLKAANKAKQDKLNAAKKQAKAASDTEEIKAKSKLESANAKMSLKERKQALKERKQQAKQDKLKAKVEAKQKAQEQKQQAKQNKKSIAEEPAVGLGYSLKATNVYANRGSYTDDQLTAALKRLTTEKAVRQLAAEEKEAKRNPVIKFAAKYGAKALDKTMNNIIDRGVNAATGALMDKLLGVKTDKTDKKQKTAETSTTPDLNTVIGAAKETINNAKAAASSTSSSQPNVRHKIKFNTASKSSKSDTQSSWVSTPTGKNNSSSTTSAYPRYVQTTATVVSSTPISKIKLLGSGK